VIAWLLSLPALAQVQPRVLDCRGALTIDDEAWDCEGPRSFLPLPVSWGARLRVVKGRATLVDARGATVELDAGGTFLAPPGEPEASLLDDVIEAVKRFIGTTTVEGRQLGPDAPPPPELRLVQPIARVVDASRLVLEWEGPDAEHYLVRLRDGDEVIATRSTNKPRAKLKGIDTDSANTLSLDVWLLSRKLDATERDLETAPFAAARIRALTPVEEGFTTELRVVESVEADEAELAETLEGQPPLVEVAVWADRGYPERSLAAARQLFDDEPPEYFARAIRSLRREGRTHR